MNQMQHRTLESLEENLNYTINEYTEGNRNLDDVLHAADGVMCYKANIGINTHRLPFNEREKAFHDQWLEENTPLSYINTGHGILQDLFIETTDLFLGRKRVIEEISNKDRKIVATVIQWLGSNCGMCFLQEALARFGAKIVYESPKQTENNISSNTDRN